MSPRFQDMPPYLCFSSLNEEVSPLPKLKAGLVGLLGSDLVMLIGPSSRLNEREKFTR
jgi:hypothetical protein